MTETKVDIRRWAAIIPNARPAPKIQNIMGGYSPRSTTVREYRPPPFEFEQLDYLHDTEGFAKRIVDRMTNLIDQEGYHITGKNERSLEYIRQRIKTMEVSMGRGFNKITYPFRDLIVEISRDLIKYHNVFLVKSRLRRDVQNALSPVSIFKMLTGVNDRGPITGYWQVHPSKMIPEVDDVGRVIKWEYTNDDGGTKKISPADVIHVAITPTRGQIFGKPFGLNAIDDVKALREFEENTLEVLYRHIFPMVLMKVGLAQSGLYGRPEEVSALQSTVDNMANSAFLACTERYTAEPVLQSSGLTDQNSLLQYFKNRALSSLQGDPFIVGDIDGINNAVADQIRQETYLWVKGYQRVVASIITDHIFREWLMEDSWNILNTDIEVTFEFKELDFDNKIKHENHAIQKYMDGVTTLDEARKEIGLDSMSDEELKRTYVYLVKVPEIEAAGEEQVKVAHAKPSGTVDNKNKPANQHGKKGSPQKGRK